MNNNDLLQMSIEDLIELLKYVIITLNINHKIHQYTTTFDNKIVEVRINNIETKKDKIFKKECKMKDVLKNKLLKYLIKEVECAWGSEGCWFSDFTENQIKEIEELIDIFKKENE